MDINDVRGKKKMTLVLQMKGDDVIQLMNALVEESNHSEFYNGICEQVWLQIRDFISEY